MEEVVLTELALLMVVIVELAEDVVVELVRVDLPLVTAKYPATATMMITTSTIAIIAALPIALRMVTLFKN